MGQSAYRVPFGPYCQQTADTSPECPGRVKLRRTQCEHMFSDLPLKADIAQCSRHVSNVPKGDIAARKKKPPEGGFSISNPMIVDQAAIKAGLDFRRYAMKPTPAKSRIIIAQVDGSGTPLVRVTVVGERESESPPILKRPEADEDPTA
jgi:hypothetical protein